MVILGPVGIAAAALGGLLTGGLGAIRANRQAKQSSAEIQKAQADQAIEYNNMITANNAAQSRLASMQAADRQSVQQYAAPAKEMIGNPNIARALKFGGLNTVNTSLSGDTTTPNTVRRRLLNL